MKAPCKAVARILCTFLAFQVYLWTSEVAGQLPAGRVVGWGDSFWGQTNVPVSATNITAIAAKGDFSMALRANGEVLMWGTLAPAAPPGGFVGIAAGMGHALALRANGTVTAWGQGDAGQTNVPAGLTNVSAIAAGDFHSLAVRSGQIIGWGATNFGKTTPPAGLNNNVVAVAAGANHSVALRANGSVFAWGDPANGGVRINVPPAAGSGITAIAAGANHSLALKNNGTVVAWGINGSGQISVPLSLTNVSAIAAGGDHSLAVLSNGTVFAWGNNSSFQTNPPAGTTNIILVAAGQMHSLALRLEPLLIGAQPQSQTVLAGATVVFSVGATGSQPINYQWRKNGNPISNATNSSYSLFNVTTNDIALYSVLVGNPLGSVTSSNAVLQVNVPAFIAEQPQGTNVGVGGTARFEVVAGGTTPISYQWRKDGSNLFAAFNRTFTVFNVQPSNAGIYTVVVSNQFGPPVISQPALLTVSTGPGITQQPASQTVIAGGSVTFTVVATNAESYQWSRNNVAIPNATNSFYAIANVQTSHAGTYSVRVSNAFGSVNSANANLTVTTPAAATSRVVGWGDQLVFNGIEWINVSPPTNLGAVVAVAVGGLHSLALRSDGSVVGWGDNTFGQAGAPQEASNVVAIAAGLHHSVALRSDGKVVAWGRGDNFQQTTLPGHSNVIRIAAGANHSLAVQSNGVVLGWGRNDDGRATPHPALGLSKAVGAGADHSLGVRTNSTVRGWGGQNLHGETLVPPGLSNVVAVTGGANHSLALRSNGTVVAWGSNLSGQTNVPAFASPVTAIASGANHCLALLQNGTVVAWGLGSSEQTNTPALTGVIAIAAGANRNLAVVPRRLDIQNPQRLVNGHHRLTIGNDDGSPVTPAQMAKVQVFGSTNIATPGGWVQLTNAMSIINGSIRMDDSQTNLLRRFYRARENP